MKTKKVLLSNSTNSSKLDDQLSRIFVGNLNTNQISKKQMLKLFNKFGQIKAISLHKGYAFIQYFYKEHAVQKMHGEKIKGQSIDVNLVNSRRKTYQKDRSISNHKIQTEKLAGNDKNKKNKLFSEMNFLNQKEPKNHKIINSSYSLPSNSFMSLIYQKYSFFDPVLSINDIMVCGICKSIFYNFELFVQHKQQFCSSLSSTSISK